MTLSQFSPLSDGSLTYWWAFVRDQRCFIVQAYTLQWFIEFQLDL